VGTFPSSDGRDTVSRRARIQGSWTFVSLNSRLERIVVEEEGSEFVSEDGRQDTSLHSNRAARKGILRVGVGLEPYLHHNGGSKKEPPLIEIMKNSKISCSG
jgi:hypothetical protein